MAFTTTFTLSQSNNCADLSLTDTSTGYVFPGGGNPPTIDGNPVITGTQISVVKGDTTYLFEWDDLEAVFNAAESLSDLVFALAGMTVTDGLHTVTYTVVTSAGSNEKESNVYFTCNIECCVNKQIAKIPYLYTCDKCDLDALAKINAIYAMYQSLKLACEVGNNTAADSIYTLLAALCDYNNCNCN